MYRQKPTDINSFFIAGINYKKTDASVRGRFAISNEQYMEIISAAGRYGITEFFVLSTCNRTEIYGFASSAADLVSLLCSHTTGNKEDFTGIAYVKNGEDAIQHLFSVAAGLDSQILGDYEIVGQIKMAVKFAKERNCIGSYLERMINEVLQASKKIRTNTALSSGTVSVSFAAVQYLKMNCNDLEKKKILLVGTGKIGTNLCRNLVDYLPGTDITVVNRSAEKAVTLSAEMNVKARPIEDLRQCIGESDIILIATNAEEPVVFKEQFVASHNAKLIIDLSVPCNVDAAVKELGNISVVNVDELSRIKDETLLKRAAEVPRVRCIIGEHVNEFLEWHRMRKNVPVLKHIKSKLLTISEDSNLINQPASAFPSPKEKNTEEAVQKVINGMAMKMRTQNQYGCICIEAMHEFISTASN